jgi:hypothetical protein
MSTSAVRTTLLVLTCGLIGAGGAFAQQPAAATASRAAQATPPPDLPTLKVDIVFSRYQGTRRTSSMPYSLLVNAASDVNRAPTSTLRVGIDAPTGRSTTTVQNGVATPSPEYKYIGTDIDCRAEYRNAPTFRIWLNLQDYSFASNPTVGETGATTPVTPRFDTAIRRFAVSNTLTVRDGQTVQFSMGTDPITGETIRAEVTVTALK